MLQKTRDAKFPVVGISWLCDEKFLDSKAALVASIADLLSRVGQNSY
jgi:hypothetical protein